jgi:hypothetical protein
MSIIVMCSIVVILIACLGYYRTYFGAIEDADLKDALDGKLFPCVLIDGATVGVVDAATGGVVGGRGLALMGFGAFRKGRAYFKNDEFLIDTVDPSNVNQRKEMMRIHRNGIRKMIFQPYDIGAQVSRLATQAAIVGASLGFVFVITLFTVVGFDRPGTLAIVIPCGFVGGLLMALIFVLPNLLTMRRKRLLVEIQGDGNLRHGVIAIDFDNREEVVSILGSLEIPMEAAT